MQHFVTKEAFRVWVVLNVILVRFPSLAEAVLCVWKVSGSNLGHDTRLMWRTFSVVFVSTSGRIPVHASDYSTTTFVDIYFNSLLTNTPALLDRACIIVIAEE